MKISINFLINKDMIKEAMNNCYYILANYPNDSMKNNILYSLYRIYLEYLGDVRNANMVLSDNGSKYSFGIYICRFDAGSYSKTIKLLLIK